MPSWLDADREELDACFRAAGQPAFRAAQFRDWLHAKRVPDFSAMKNLPAALRDSLAARRPLRALRLLRRREAVDGLAAKWLHAAGGEEENTRIESVLIVEKRRSRRTVCVSCMAGCPLACAFCATGSGGYRRDLSAGEIIEQVYSIDGELRAGGGDGVSHVVFMGMGEPLLNFAAVLRAADAFADPAGLGLSGRHLTISTAGVPEGVERLAASRRNYRLAVSLHAPNQKVRERIMPAARRWPLDRLFPSLEKFAAAASRGITFEYCLLDGVNAGREQAAELARLIGGFHAKVNLIPMNPVPGCALRAPPAPDIRRFQETLLENGVAATLRTEKGAEIGGACGQLMADGK